MNGGPGLLVGFDGSRMPPLNSPRFAAVRVMLSGIIVDDAGCHGG
jgi:hypothetical protein